LRNSSTELLISGPPSLSAISVPADVLHFGLPMSQLTEDMAKQAVQQAKANAQTQATGTDVKTVSAIISTKEKASRRLKTR